MPIDGNVLRTIGALEAGVQNLIDLASKMDDKNTDERNRIHERLEELDRLLTRVSADLDNYQRRVDEKLDDLEPTVKSLEKNYLQSVGARHFGKIVWTAIVSMVSLLVTIAYHAFELFSGGKLSSIIGH